MERAERPLPPPVAAAERLVSPTVLPIMGPRRSPCQVDAHPLFDWLRQVGICPLLVPDGRRRPVAGVDNRVVGQREHLVANALQQQFAIAAGEVVSPDAAAK